MGGKDATGAAIPAPKSKNKPRAPVMPTRRGRDVIVSLSRVSV